LTVVKKRQAAPYAGVAFFFIFQWFDPILAAFLHALPEMITHAHRNSFLLDSGFVSAFRFQRLLNISNDQTCGSGAREVCLEEIWRSRVS
jgi:hypothetical protein